MAGAVRDPAGDLTPALPEDASGFSFFQLVLLLDRFFADRPSVGAVQDAGREHTRFRALLSLGFPAADIADYAWKMSAERPDAPPHLSVTATFLGLYGPASPLPPHVTEGLLFGDPENDAPRDFLDLFNHRLIALLFRVWKKYRFYANFTADAADEFSRSLFALIGLQRGGRDDEAFDWTVLLRFAGALGLNCRSPAIVSGVIAAYFGVPARIEEAVERWVTIPEPQQNRLGGRRSTLASDWVLGGKLPDVAGKFRIWLGPLTRAEFQRFLPGSDCHRALHALVRNLLRDALEFDVWATLSDGEMPAMALESGAALPLGWSSWLGSHGPASGGVALPLG